MKKIIIVLALLLIVPTAYSQKKKPVKASKAQTTAIAKSGNINAELLKKKDAYKFYLLLAPNAKKQRDTVSLNTFAYDPKAPAATQTANIPTNCVITPFTAKGTSLYSITWIEKSLTEVPDKKEDKTTTVTQIWNLNTKNQLYANSQASTKITEILYLDKGHDASQTSEKMRNEGFAMTITKEGDIVLKNRTQENRLSYDAAEGKFIPVKGTAQPAPAAAKKKK
jgi:hypothetical protein